MLKEIQTKLRVALTPKFMWLHKQFKDNEFCLLDVGCGNHSPQKTKYWFAKCKYYGLDWERYNLDENDMEAMEKYYEIDLARNSLDILPDEFFDAVVMNHIIEHIPNGLQVIEALLPKLKLGGVIYIEFPSVHSLSLPSMKGCLNFCDDPSHIRIYDLKEIGNILLKHKFKILKGGVRRVKLRILVSPLTFLYHQFYLKCSTAADFADLLGFAEFLFAKKQMLTARE